MTTHILTTLRALWSLVPTLIYASAFLWIGLYTNHSIRVTRIQEAKASVIRAEHELNTAKAKSEAAQFQAIQTYWALEAERTDVERARKKAVMAEMRLQKACAKLRGKC